MEKFQEYTDDTKRKNEEAEQNKLNGFSIEVKIKTKITAQYYWLVVTGNFRSGSEIYLIDMAKKLGEGMNASTYMAYDLRRGIKVAARALNKKAASRDFSLNRLLMRIRLLKLKVSLVLLMAMPRQNYANRPRRWLVINLMYICWVCCY